MTRGGRVKDRATPMRRCIATGQTGPTSGLIRFVVSPEGELVADVASKLPGRGIWVVANRSALSRAATKGLFERAARQPVRLSPSFVEDVEAALRKRVIERLSIARKAGDAVAGATKVKEWLSKGAAALLLQAKDGSEREKSRLRPPGGPETRIEVLTASEIGLSFGREHVIHAALAAGGLADRFREDAMRLSGVRELDGGTSAGKVKKNL